MNTLRNRREFLAEVGRGMLVTTVGLEVASGLGLATATAAEAPETALTFGPLEPLVALMQETPVAKLLPILAGKLRAGTSLRDLTAAGALANARTFGGEDYVGFHTMMALSPALHMSRELAAPHAALGGWRAAAAPPPHQHAGGGEAERAPAAPKGRKGRGCAAL